MPPERSCPRGAEDNNLFRERLDQTCMSARLIGAVVLELDRFKALSALYAKGTAGIHAGSPRFVVRRRRFDKGQTVSLCGPSHVVLLMSRSQLADGLANCYPHDLAARREFLKRRDKIGPSRSRPCDTSRTLRRARLIREGGE